MLYARHGERPGARTPARRSATPSRQHGAPEDFSTVCAERVHCYSGLSPRVRTLSSILPPGSRAEGWPWAVVSLGVSVTKSTPAREPLALRWPLPEPPLVPPALCKPRRQRKQRASAAPGAAAAGCQLDARQSPRAWQATSPAGLVASRRSRPRAAPWRAPAGRHASSRWPRAMQASASSGWRMA